MPVPAILKRLWKKITRDRAITVEEIESVLRLPVLGVIPHLERRRARAPLGDGPVKRRIESDGRWGSRLLHRWPENGLEAVAYIRIDASLKNAAPQHTHPVFWLTSRSRGEGVSLTAVNLAITGARRGARILVVDADLSDARLTRILGLSREPGLYEAIDRALPLTSVVHSAPELGFDLVPSGQPIGGSDRLWSLPAWPRLLEQARSIYGCVLIDGPLSGLRDAAMVPCVDGIVLVHQLGRGSLASAPRLARELDPLRPKLLGAIINDVAL